MFLHLSTKQDGRKKAFSHSPCEDSLWEANQIDHLKVFGCLFFASNLLRRDKFDSRANKTFLIGYSKTQKNYKLYDLESMRFLVSRYVTIREHDFSFKGMQLDMQDTFPQHLPDDLGPEVPPTVVLPSLENYSHEEIQEDIFVKNEDRAESGDHSHNLVHPITEALPVDSLDTTQTHDGADTSEVPHTANVDQETWKTARISKSLIWLKTMRLQIFFFTGNNLYPLSYGLSYVTHTISYQTYLEVFYGYAKPSSFKEASQDNRQVE